MDVYTLLISINKHKFIFILRKQKNHYMEEKAMGKIKNKMSEKKQKSRHK